MKIVKVTIGGTPTVGDTVLLMYSSPRGGRTEAGHVVRENQQREGSIIRLSPDTLEQIAEGIAQSMRKHFMPEAFRWQANGASIRIECQDAVSDVTFFSQVLSESATPSETVEIVEL